jgi:hypothetical protein
VFGFLSVVPAVWSNNAAIVREYAMQILLACLALALCIVERHIARKIVIEGGEEPQQPTLPANAGSFSPWR